MMKPVSEISVLELLPQQPPFVMVDKLLHVDDTAVSSSFRVMPDNLFVENDVLTEPGIIEHIAQTCAARLGYINKYLRKDNIKLGFIGEIKNLTIEKTPHVGDELTTDVIIVKEILSTLLVRARVKVNDDNIASCEMKIFMSDIVQGR